MAPFKWSWHPDIGYEQELSEEKVLPPREAGGELHMRASSSRSYDELSCPDEVVRQGER
jgi:hypothetical protein